MPHATVTPDLSRPIGAFDPMIFGQYLEHVQPEDRCIYGAIVDEESSHVDALGYRTDVIEAVRALEVPVVRWPGGCFADIYHWEDGVGPIDQRPVRRNWHWGGIETNQFGTDEFLRWCERVGTLPYMNLNFGTGTLDEAIRWIDYCNGTDPTTEVQRRRANGHGDPYGVPYWGVGNEQWGDWEAGHMDARSYAAQLRNWTQFFSKLDPRSRFIGIGSPAARDPEWDLTVVGEAGHLIDFLTLHIYGYNVIGDVNDYYPTVTFPVYVEERIRQMAGVIATAMHDLDRDEPIRISIDEWNIRHLVFGPDDGPPTLRRLSPRTLQDAIAAAGVFHAMLRNTPAVGMANYVFLLNGNGVLLVEPEGIVKTPLYHLFHLYRQHLLPIMLDGAVTSGSFTTSVRQDRPGQSAVRDVPYVDAIATTDQAGSELAAAIINRHRSETAAVTIVPRNATCAPHATLHTLHHADPSASNELHHPDVVQPSQVSIAWDGTVEVPRIRFPSCASR